MWYYQRVFRKLFMLFLNKSSATETAYNAVKAFEWVTGKDYYETISRIWGELASSSPIVPVAKERELSEEQ